MDVIIIIYIYNLIRLYTERSFLERELSELPKWMIHTHTRTHTQNDCMPPCMDITVRANASRSSLTTFINGRNYIRGRYDIVKFQPSENR